MQTFVGAVGPATVIVTSVPADMTVPVVVATLSTMVPKPDTLVVNSILCVALKSGIPEPTLIRGAAKEAIFLSLPSSTD